MRRTIVLIVGMSALGCVQHEFSRASSFAGVEELIEQPAVQGDPANDAKPDGLILVGTVSAFRPLTGKNFDEIYAEYRDFSELIHPSSPPSFFC